MGPQHPSTHGVLRLVLKLAGERVVGCIPVMGYLHRGLEKIFEWRTYHQGIRYADQADYVSNMLNEHAYAGAMEAIGDIDVPRRAEFIRVIVDEMSRCASHLVWLGTYLLDLGATTPILWCFRDREQILDMFEGICGSPFKHNYYRPGGPLYDFPPGLLAKLERFLDRLGENIEEYREPLEVNEVYYPIEGAKGEIGYYMISKVGPNPYRAKMRGASFCNLQLLPMLLRGRLVADAIAILGSIDIVLGEVDR